MIPKCMYTTIVLKTSKGFPGKAVGLNKPKPFEGYTYICINVVWDEV